MTVDLIPGNRYRIVFEGLATHKTRIRCENKGEAWRFDAESELLVAKSIEELPPEATPLQKGELVTWGAVTVQMTVAGIDGGVVWLQDEFGCYRSLVMSDLCDFRRADPSAPPILIGK